MKLGATIFLRGVLALIGIAALVILLVQPHFEGRNVNATAFEVYFHDPFLAYLYVASIPFFIGLYHAFKLLGYVGRDKEFSLSAVRSARIIKYCAIAFVVFIAGAEIIILMNDTDDHAGPVMLGIIIAFASLVVATGMSVLERTLQSAVDIKSENDLTV